MAEVHLVEPAVERDPLDLAGLDLRGEDDLHVLAVVPPQDVDGGVVVAEGAGLVLGRVDDGGEGVVAGGEALLAHDEEGVGAGAVVDKVADAEGALVLDLDGAGELVEGQPVELEHLGGDVGVLVVRGQAGVVRGS